MIPRAIEVERLAKGFRIPGVEPPGGGGRARALLRGGAAELLPVLRDVSFSVPRGEAVALMGRNGSGKSTLLRILAGIYLPDDGRVRVEGSVTPILELGAGWSPDLDATGNLRLAGAALGFAARAVEAQIPRILAFAGLQRFAALPLRHFSSGMAARLSYAAAFEAPGDVLLLDEVFAVGDAAFRARCEARYRTLRDGRRTIVLVSHDGAAVERFCDRALLLEGGRIVEDGPPHRVARAYARVVARPAAPGPAFAAGARAAASGPPPKVSVLVPCHDLGATLDEAVESALAQTLSDVEVVVVDDGSTDPLTVRLLSDYRRPRTRVVRTPNRGLAAARNRALHEARGEYVCALDADDRLEPTFLEKAVAVLEADPGVAFVSCWLRTFGTEEWDWRPNRCELPALLAECTVATAAVVRREAVLAAGGWDAGMRDGYEDWDLWITLVESGHRGVILPETLFRYRIRPGSMSARCTVGSMHAQLMQYLVTKHEASYRRHVFDVLLAKEAQVAELARENDLLERRLETELWPEAERRATLAATLARLAAARPPAASSGGERSGTGAVPPEAAALHASLSWRVTGPLRAVHGWILRFTGGL